MIIPKPRLRILVVRHGETDWNKKRVFQGQTDTTLNHNGEAQAVAVQHALFPLRLTAAYSSDLSRARKTAEIIAQPHGLVVQTDTRLREISFGVFEGKSHEQLLDSEWADHFINYKQDPFRNRPPEGEQPEEVLERVSTFYQGLCEQHEAGETVLVAAHGGSCRMLICAAMGAPAELNRHIRLDNCSISELEYHDGFTMVTRLNDTHHLTAGGIAQVI
ncbi:MAG: histidine phosphatase family protein [Armatimonadota bacterium]